MARKLDGILQEQTRENIPNSMKNDHWRYFALRPFEGADEIPDDWAQAFHGTWFPTLWSILDTQGISASTDMSEVHESHYLGSKVYVTPKLETAISCAGAQNLLAMECSIGASWSFGFLWGWFTNEQSEAANDGHLMLT